MTENDVHSALTYCVDEQMNHYGCLLQISKGILYYVRFIPVNFNPWLCQIYIAETNKTHQITFEIVEH